MEQEIASQVVGLGGSTDFSLLSLFLRADIVVKSVIIILIAASIFSWALIFDKYKLFKKWLSTKGSPRSIIKSTSFEEREISEDDEVPKTFKIRKVLLANGKQWADR